MTAVCNCDEAQEGHEHCDECGCVLTSHESETHCRWCEARMANEKLGNVPNKTDSKGETK